MAYKDHFVDAEILDTLGWTGMPEQAQIQKLAHLYLKEERNIRYYARRYNGPTDGTVRPFVKSHFQPPRGRLKPVIEGVIKAVEEQRKKRKERKEGPFRPFKWKKPSPKERRDALCAARFTITQKDWRGDTSTVDPNCVAVGTIGDVFMLVEGGGYYHQPRIYMKHKPTGKEKVVVLEGERLKGLNTAMLRIAPKGAMRGVFGGSTVRLDFYEEAFEVDGQMIPWSKVSKVYKRRSSTDEGRTLIKTKAKPKKDR